jgi:hypothetical protein
MKVIKVAKGLKVIAAYCLLYNAKDRAGFLCYPRPIDK